MKKYIKFGIIVVLIPLLLELFIFSNDYISNVTNDGWASFFGGYIGGIATLLAVLWTIDENKKSISEQRNVDEENDRNRIKLSVMPYLQTSYSFYDEKAEIRMFDYICMVDEEKIKQTFTQDDKDFLASHKNKRDYCFLAYIIRNAGAGGAIDLRIEINGIDYEQKNAIPKNNYLIIYLWKKIHKNSPNDIIINMDYWDTIKFCHYCQNEKMSIKLKDDKLTVGSDSEYRISQQEYK